MAESRENLVIIAPNLPPSQGGMERQAYLQAKELSNSYAVSFFAANRNKELFKNTDVKFFQVQSYEKKFAKEINSILIFLNILKNISLFKKSKIYIHQFNLLTFLVLILCRVTGKRAVVKVANSGSKFDIQVFFNRYKILKIFRTVIDSDKFTLLFLTKENNLDLERNKFKYIKSLIFRNGVEVVDKQSDTLSDRIMYLGRLEKVKRLDVVLNLAAIMQDYHFSIFGDGSLSKDVELAGHTLNNLNYYGEIKNEDIPWSDVDWVILPSETEGMSNVLLEAIANGKGLIVSKIEQNKFVESITNKVVWLDKELTDVADEIHAHRLTPMIRYRSFDKYNIKEVVFDLAVILNTQA